MASPPRTATSGTFFITAITHNRRRLFQVDANARLLLETLQHYRAKNLYKLHAFVVMPDHIHLLITTGNLSEAVRHIKGGFSRRLTSKLPAWQHGFTDHLVLNRDQFQSRRDYIHQNPVRARLVTNPELYPYSSAYPGQAPPFSTNPPQKDSLSPQRKRRSPNQTQPPPDRNTRERDLLLKRAKDSVGL